MAIHLTPEQERRVHAVMDRGAYESVGEVVDAALAAVEQRAVPGFAGTPGRTRRFACGRAGIARSLRKTSSGVQWRRKRTPCSPSIKRARVREGYVSESRQRRYRAPVSLLPRYPESSQRGRSLPNGCPANSSMVAAAPVGGSALSFQQPAASDSSHVGGCGIRGHPDLLPSGRRHDPRHSDSARQARC